MAKTRFTISTKLFGPTSPFGSGGFTRKPKMLKLSWLLSPSKFCCVDGIAAGPDPDCRAPSVEYRPSPVEIGPRSGSFAGSSAAGAVLPAASSRSGRETSRAAAHVTVGAGLAAGGAVEVAAAGPPSAAATHTAASRIPPARNPSGTRGLSLRSVCVDRSRIESLPRLPARSGRRYGVGRAAASRDEPDYSSDCAHLGGRPGCADDDVHVRRGNRRKPSLRATRPRDAGADEAG